MIPELLFLNVAYHQELVYLTVKYHGILYLWRRHESHRILGMKLQLTRPRGNNSEGMNARVVIHVRRTSS